MTSLDEIDMSNIQDQSLLELQREWATDQGIDAYAYAKATEPQRSNKVNNFTVEDQQNYL